MKRLLEGISVAALVLLLGILYTKHVNLEGFQTSTNTVVLRGSLQTLTSISNLKGLALSAKMPYNAAFQVNEIQNSKSERVWAKGDAQSSDAAIDFYVVNFVPNFQLDPFISRLTQNTRNIDYIGTTLPSNLTKTIILKGSPVNITSSAGIRSLSTAPSGTVRPEYTPLRITGPTGTLLWSSSAANAAPSTDTMVAYWKVEYGSQFSADTFKRILLQKGAGLEYVGLSFPKDLTIPKESPKKAAPQLTGPAASVNTRYVAPERKEPEYKDPRRQDLGPRDYSKFVAFPGATVTDRIKVQAKYKTITDPRILASLEKGLGSTPDSGPIRITEILNSDEQQLWPKPAIHYTDSGVADVFIVGFNTQVDVNTTIKPYMEKFTPSVLFYAPAMSRRKRQETGSKGIFQSIFG
jgi:hypothetical protein